MSAERGRSVQAPRQDGSEVASESPGGGVRVTPGRGRGVRAKSSKLGGTTEAGAFVLRDGGAFFMGQDFAGVPAMV